MKPSISRAWTIILLTGMCVLQTSPAFAQFTGVGTQATNWVVQLVTPLIPLAVAVVGLMCFTGRVNWAWFAAALIGCALFFGRNQVVSMLRSWLGA